MNDSTNTNDGPGNEAPQGDQRLTIGDLLSERAERSPDAPAVMAPGVPAMTYRGLADQAAYVRGVLAENGLGPGDRVALALPNGPDCAVSFLAVSSGAICCPLNPGYRAEEFDFYLADTRAKSVIVPAGTDTPARDRAAALGLSLYELAPSASGPAGAFRLRLAGHDGRTGEPEPHAARAPPSCEDIALILHTSGTTSRPKIVPLTHRNLLASARNIASWYAFGGDDRCINVMPLFHIHGLVAGLLAPLWSGGSTVCPRAFDPEAFFRWLADFEPTWVTAVPTMLQAVLRHAPRHAESLATHRLRFIRSSSAPLPPRAAEELEAVFGAPVLQAYSMTETAHQMTSSPLPPKPRKPGAVSLPAGVALAILDEAGNELAPGRVGEVAVRGPTVIAGYENNPAANESAFTNGWFRTGDQGVIDEDGHLSLTGRLKEIIIRGGENVAPLEIDKVLLEHPAVAEALSFSIPHPTLGEEIGAAVVLREGEAATEQEIRAFAAGKLAEFKLPRRIVFQDKLPRGPTGKLQRIGMAERLGIGTGADGAARQAPRTPLERMLAEIWCARLDRESVGIDDEFFALGGDSLQAVEIFAEIADRLGQPVSHSAIVQASTIRDLARLIEGGEPWSCLVPMRESGARPPFFCVHGLDGEALPLRGLAMELGPDQPFYALQARGIDGTTPLLDRIEDMAALYVEEIRRVQPAGPYFIGGYSFGVVVAFEVARRLREAGEPVPLLAFIAPRKPPSPAKGRYTGRVLWKLAENFERLSRRGGRGRIEYVAGKATRRLFGASKSGESAIDEQSIPADQVAWWRFVESVNTRAWRAYRPDTYDGEAILIRTPQDDMELVSDLCGRWLEHLVGPIEIRPVPGDHLTLLSAPHVEAVAEVLAGAIRAADRGVGA